MNQGGRHKEESLPRDLLSAIRIFERWQGPIASARILTVAAFRWTQEFVAGIRGAVSSNREISNEKFAGKQKQFRR